MNRIIAYELVTVELATYRSLPYDELRQLVGERTSRLVRGTDGIDYDLSIRVAWRHGTAGDINVAVLAGAADWGSPHDTLGDNIIVSPRATGQSATSID
jgi:hypothetical protein